MFFKLIYFFKAADEFIKIELSLGGTLGGCVTLRRIKTLKVGPLRLTLCSFAPVAFQKRPLPLRALTDTRPDVFVWLRLL